MKVFAAILLCGAMAGAALAQDEARRRVLVDPDFGLTFQTPAGFHAEMVGQTPEGLVMVTVATDDPDLPPIDTSGNFCDITFQYDPAYGQGDQAWVNSLVDGTGFYENMAEQVPVPGTIEDSEHFTHRSSSAHRFDGQLEPEGAFSVAVIPSPEGFVQLTCITKNTTLEPAKLAPILDAITMPGQNRDHLVASGRCEADVTALHSRLEHAGSGPFDAETVAALDAERKAIAAICDDLDADVLLDRAVAAAGYEGDYRSLRYDALAQIGSDLLTDEQREALDGGRIQVVATSDEATGERYVRYMHFIVGLRSLD